MPLTRYQIRNEFNLADPDLYRAADKDDPEALLEGVAMAGLVGVLRQLGDLAEFAAEIFHDLHEEVMATAARGHGLMDRIQQLEADVPLIEKNLLSQTNHTAFYYNKGVYWHPQMCTDQNLITQGDMPRFIRDSYEECRGPPQLFLLDKFDIGGAGACLKRYTDPSSFKAEPTASDAAKLEAKRDRRTRKIKKKGSQWRNGNTPEVLTTSHAKLHRLLLEERIGDDSKVPARLVKLKKRTHDGLKSTKSYMEKFLQTMSPEHSETHEVEVSQPTLRLTYNHIDDSEREILDIQPVSAAQGSLHLSHTDQETKLRPSAMYSYDFNKSRRSKSSTVSLEDGNTIGTASPLRIPVAEKELGVDGANSHGNGVISLYPDDMASETENYMDALANMESEAETDNEYIPKKELRYFSKHAGVHISGEQVMIDRDRFIDSQSVDNSITSDDGSISFMKGTSTSSLHGAPHEEHGDREAESSLSMMVNEAVIVDYSDSFDYDKTKRPTSNGYLNVNGETVGSTVTSFNSEGRHISVHKDSSHLLQSSESGLRLRQFSMTSSEGIYYSECLQGERSRVNGGDDTTPDGPCEDDNKSVIQTSNRRHEPKVSSEALTHFSNDSSHDHFKWISTTKNETSQNGYIDEFSAEELGNEEIASSQPATNAQKQDFNEGSRDRDCGSHLLLPADDHVGNNHAIVSKDVNASVSFGEILDESNHATDSAQEMYGSFSAETNAAATKLLAASRDTEAHVSSDKLSIQRVPEDAVAAESDSGGKHDYGLAVFPRGGYSPSRNRNSNQISISSSDYLHHGGVQSQGISSLRSDLNEVEDFRRKQAVCFEQSDSVDNQASDRLRTVTHSTSLMGKDQNPELANPPPLHFDASSFPPSNQELLFYQEDPQISEPHLGQMSTPNKASAVDLLTQDNSLKQESDGEVIFQSGSKFGDLESERKVSLEGAPPLPPLPPVQWIAGKPQDSFLDSDRGSEKIIMASNGSLPPFAFGLKGSFHFTPLDGDIKQPLKATQTDESLPHTSSLYPGGFSLPTESTPQLNDTIDVHGQHILLTSDKMVTNSSINHPKTDLQSGKPDPLAFARETSQPSTGSCLPTSSTDTHAFTMEQPSYTARHSMPLLEEMTTHIKETILPRPTEHGVLYAGDTAEPSATCESPQPQLGDTIVCESKASEVPMHSTDQSLEESTSYSITEHAAQNADEKIIKHPEMPKPQIKNKEHRKQEMNSSEREATWSLALLNYEDEKLAQKPAVKPPRPRNPLIESVDALDRSKLKKVTPRNQPQTPTVDERGSLLEQIRAKSFNLKPAPAPMPKPSILAPSMNLKVAAILEKANKIRRATAGSDEDEDEWSDD
ncbi:unnamed protein product [Rhodiola kirilowii]